MAQAEVEARSGEEPARAIALVDSDIHPMIPFAELERRLPARWREHLQRFGRRTPHVTEHYPRASNGGYRVDSWPDGGPAGSDLDLLRAQVLDEYGVDYGILNALVLLQCHEQPELALAIARAVNDWMWEDWLEPEPRLLGAIVVPYEYPELAVSEIERCAVDRRWVQVIFPDGAESPLGSRRYWPIYEAAAAHGLPVAFHTAGYWPHLDTGWPSYYLEEHVANSCRMQSQLMNLVCEGVFAAVPELEVVLTEGGLAWTASVLWALDGAWELLREETPWLERPPSETIHEHVWFTTQPIEEPDDAQDLVRTLEHGALADRLLFATDYPHWDFDSPSQALPAALPPELRAAILGGNATALYDLPLDRPRS